MDKNNDMLLNFLHEITDQIKKEQMSDEDILSVYEFFYKFKLLKNNHVEDDVIKYCALGYHIYSNLKKQDK